MNSFGTFKGGAAARRELRVLALILVLMALGATVWAQEKEQHDVHQGHDMEKMPGMEMKQPKTEQTPPEKQSAPSPKDDMSGMDMSGAGEEEGTGMMSMGPLMVMSGDEMGIRIGSSRTNFVSMGQMGSGTAWQPGSTPMYMYHKTIGDWLLMLHGEAKIGVNAQGGPRGITKFESQNWLMPMAFHKLGRGMLQLRGMFSAEPFTYSPGGSPLLFQTGESYKGRPLIDKQHPHDLFMELSATHTVPVGERGSFYTYFGYPGEPALGPVAFMHRWSASENPSAPLAHHLQDSTHITFGVFTTGFTYRKFKAEGSIFNGREPDENRYNFDRGKWDSRSIRFSYAPTNNWSLQWSYGLLRKPEALEPEGDQRRMTASVQYNKPFDRGNWASSLIWGRNHLYGGDVTANLNAYTAESTINFLSKNYLYTRLELVDKNELLRRADKTLLGYGAEDHPNFRIGAYTFGAARDIFGNDKLSVALGSDVTFYTKPAILNPLYGNNPVSYKVFMRIRPRRMTMDSMHMNHPGTTHANANEETHGAHH